MTEEAKETAEARLQELDTQDFTEPHEPFRVGRARASGE